MSSTTLDPQTQANVDEWLSGAYDKETKAKIREMLATDPQEITESFYTKLSFGTGGMRGVVGLGSNRMNDYTVRSATQGLANYLFKQRSSKSSLSVAISYDSRVHSRHFAEETAKVLAGNGIKAFLFESLRPTPVVSFACRTLHCSAAIMITASHNPPQYNGYKVYWRDGGQVLPPHDVGIIDEVNKITSPDQVKIADLDDTLIETISEEMDEVYLNTLADMQLTPELNQEEGDSLHVVYTNLHGTGITLIPQAMAMWGFTNITYVKEQQKPDGTFPTVSFPNPEERKALELGIETMIENKGDILLANDPDADRVGVAIRKGEEVYLLSGNQVASLCLEHICHQLTEQNRMPENGACIKTLVTTELFHAIASNYNISCFDVLPGFKYIAHLMTEWEKDQEGFEFIFGGEESYGYLIGTNARDKDGIVCCALIAEVALNAKKEGKTLYDKLLDLYTKYGVFREKLESIYFGETKEGRDKMQQVVESLRAHPPKSLLGTKVISIEDYQSLTKTWIETGKSERLTLSKSNLILLHLADRTKLIVRPSGTEPKVKIYCGTQNPIAEDTGLSLTIEHCDVLADEYIKTIKNQLKS